MKNKKCEFCGKKKTIEELGTVSCIECEKNYNPRTLKWWVLIIWILLTSLYIFSEKSLVSFAVGLVSGIVIGGLLSHLK